MPHPERPALSQIVDSVADGAASLDWDAIEHGLADDRDRALIRQLRILARISDVHRTAGAPAKHAETLGSKVIGRIDPVVLPPSKATRRSSSGDLPPREQFERWGHLQLVEKVGEGTFGEVYRAFDTQLHREVALKLLKPEKSPGRLAQRILREGRILARVRHPHVVVVHGAETHDGRVGLWMEFIRGATLEKLVRKQGAFSAREAALIGQDLCRAMAAVHGAGLVHRDIKAQNVMREEGGRVVLMDFGAGRSREETGPGANRLTGTPLYLAPEVLAGGDATVRSDIYSLGVLLYYLVTGDYPVKATNLDDLRLAQREGRRVRLQDARADLPDGFVRVVERAVAPNPAERFASVGELQAALTPAFGSESLDQTANLRTHSAWQRHRGRWLAAAAGTALAVLTGVAVWQLHRFGLEAAPATAVPAARVKVAVLPFDATASIPAHIVDELTRQVAEILAITSEVEVVQPTTTRALKAGGPAIAAGLPDEARARYVVTGSFSGTKQNMVGRVELRADGQAASRWSTPVVGRPSRIAADVAAGIARELGLPTRARVVSGSQSELASDFHALARQELDRGTDLTGSIALFQKAIEADPGFARAYSGLARAQMSTVPCSSNAELSRTAANSALSIDPNLTEAHAVLGWLSMMCEWDWDGAEQHFLRALELNASDAYATSGYAMFLAARDRADTGLRVMLRARDLDPLSAGTAANTAMLHIYSGSHAAAEREALRAVALDGASATARVVLCRALEAQGRFQDAITACSNASHLRIRAGGYRMQALQATLDARLGRAKAARETLAALRASAEGPSVDPVYLVFVYTALGDHDTAFALIQEAVQQRSHAVLWLPVDPRIRELRSDPRYAAFRASLGLEAARP
jgi:serine/threonine-protein kinase